ncbi:kinase-like protein [Schizopora paradoxa]|uniref:Kinase-like protein n=1 Tax=Schizopora paradoxa TaxID=27342 RepID=A0A0H2RG40_9AGAM|nr:kinase-like protein [Schizopora paradoxa]
MVQELSVWASVKHPNVLPLLGYDLSGTFPSLISPWMVRGTVRKYMDDHEGESMLHLSKGISSGLLYLHNENIIHSDLKCENVLLSDSGEPLLADFGISRCVSSLTTTTTTSAKGSTRWMAVEFFLPSVEGDDIVVEHTKETDVWAFGMVLFELLSGLVPFSHLKTDVQVAMAILSGRTPSRPVSSESENDQDLVWSLCQDCWQHVPSDRPTMLTLHGKLEKLNQFSSPITTRTSSIGLYASQDLPLENLIPRRELAIHHVLKPDSPYLVLDLTRPTFAPMTPVNFHVEGTLIATLPGYLAQVAMLPELSKITISCPHLHPFTREWTISVDTFDEESTITVGDILTSIYDSLQTPITHAEWARLSQQDITEVSAAFTQRCRKQGQASEEYKKGVRRCDFLRRKILYSGLKLAKDGDGTVFKLYARNPHLHEG